MIDSVLRILARTFLAGQWAALRAEVYRRRAVSPHVPHLTPPVIMQRLLVSGEDHRHGSHGGFDLYAICRAVWRRVVYKRREGASTIEQQIVRVLTNRFERTLSRKVHEILLATLLSEVLPKRDMPRFYLAIGYFGWRMNGFEEACRTLGLCPESISLDIAAELVARLKYPQPRFPVDRRVSEIRRRREHLKMLYRKHISNGTYAHINEDPLNGTSRSRDGASEFSCPLP